MLIGLVGPSPRCRSISTINLQRASPPIPLYVEGDERITSTQVNYCEFRLDGPVFEEVSKDWWRIDLTISILVVQKTDDKNFHIIHQMCGAVAAACVNGIPAFQFGDGPDDDPTINWGCFILDKRRGDNIVISQIGQITPELTERQAAVEVFYTMMLDG